MGGGCVDPAWAEVRVVLSSCPLFVVTQSLISECCLLAICGLWFNYASCFIVVVVVLALCVVRQKHRISFLTPTGAPFRGVYLKKKLNNIHTERVFSELDLSKAYDRVDLDFLEKALGKWGFAQQWISWVMVCVKSVKYSQIQWSIAWEFHSL